MAYIRITPDKYINTEQIASIRYHPAKTRKEKGDDRIMPTEKDVPVPSKLTITMSNGADHTLEADEADQLYESLRSNS